MTPFRDQKSEILRERGTTQSHSGIEEGPLPTQRTRISRFNRPSSPPSCFWTIWALIASVLNGSNLLLLCQVSSHIENWILSFQSVALHLCLSLIDKYQLLQANRGSSTHKYMRYKNVSLTRIVGGQILYYTDPHSNTGVTWPPTLPLCCADIATCQMVVVNSTASVPARGTGRSTDPLYFYTVFLAHIIQDVLAPLLQSRDFSGCWVDLAWSETSTITSKSVALRCRKCLDFADRQCGNSTSRRWRRVLYIAADWVTLAGNVAHSGI